MRLELVTIGTELLLGQTIDTNAAWLGSTLANHGIRVARCSTVGDEPAVIREVVQAALARSGTVITTGGLGPTRDDVTKHAVAALFGRRMLFSAEVWEELVARYARMGRPLGEANRSQADVPESATVLPNPRGTAPGLWIEGDAGRVVMLPGVPREMRGLMRHEVMPRLTAGAAVATVIRSRSLRTAGVPESTLAARIGAIEDSLAPLTLAYLPDVTGVDLRVTAWDLPADEADHRLDAAVALLQGLAGPHAYGGADADLAALVLEGARARGWRLAVAESCTGGLLGGRLTAVPGSSEVFAGGVVAYDSTAKVALLSVAEEILAATGAVSEPVAQAMADGAARNFRAQAAVGITGVAGPSGGTEAKPVGTVCFGFVVGHRRWTERVVFPGNRREIRDRAVQLALFRLWTALSD